jgi:transcriptional repressor NrdR
MRCPYCDNQNTRVVDTREASEKVRRRRECSGCDRRFTTYETVEKVDITVIKRDGENEEFREEKIYDGVERAASKTSITETQIEEIVDEVKKSVRDKEQVKASEIGRAVLEALKKRDEVAYMRFASVYDSFDDVESFKEEAEALQKKD